MRIKQNNFYLGYYMTCLISDNCLTLGTPKFDPESGKVLWVELYTPPKDIKILTLNTYERDLI